MKKIISTFSALVFCALAHAQTPVQVTKTAVFDFSETWCYPCGSHGVDVADTLHHRIVAQNKGYLISIKHSSTPASVNVAVGETMFDNFELPGVPFFVINKGSQVDGVTGGNEGDISRMMMMINNFNAQPAVASIAGNGSINGNTFTVNAKARFWDAATGDYSMAVLLTENHIGTPQAGYALDTAYHINVLRGVMSSSTPVFASSPWGEAVGTTSISAGQEFSKSFQATIDPTWKTENLVAFAIIFRKTTEGKYEAVNIEQVSRNTTSVRNLDQLKQIRVYPNPASDKIHIGFQTDKVAKLTMNLCDISGKIIKSSYTSTQAGENIKTIDVSNIPGGNYFLNLYSDAAPSVALPLVISK